MSSSSSPSSPVVSAENEACEDLRCACGKLLARLTPQGIELKCGRCRRVIVIDWSQVRDERGLAPAHCPGARV